MMATFNLTVEKVRSIAKKTKKTHISRTIRSCQRMKIRKLSKLLPPIHVLSEEMDQFKKKKISIISPIPENTSAKWYDWLFIFNNYFISWCN